MKLHLILPLLAGCLASSVAHAQTVSLVNHTYEAPTNLVVNYPPAKGEKFLMVSSGLGGWSGGGTMQMAYAKGIGMGGTGGIYAKVTKAGRFAQVNFSKLDFSAFRDDHLLRDVVRSVRVSFDANVPVGHEFIVYMQADTPKELGLIESQWSTRLVLGKVKGEGQYAHYAFSGDVVSEEVAAAFINYVRSLYLNGVTKLSGSLTFHLDPEQWPEGMEFTFDNVKLTLEAK